MENFRWTFPLVLSLLMLSIVVTGFSATFFLRPFFWPRENEFFPGHGPELPSYLIAHGIILTAWYSLATIQAGLVANQRIMLHRRAGYIGAVLAFLIVTTTAVPMIIRDIPIIETVGPASSAPNLILLSGFVFCFVTGIAYRKRPDDHKRLMMVASVWVLPPALARLIVTISLGTGLFSPSISMIVGGSTALCLLASIVVHDYYKNRRLSRGSILGVASIGVAIASMLVLVRTGIWTGIVNIFS